MATPNVWIANRGNHPYESAEKFGALKVLTDGRINIFAMDNLSAEIWGILDKEGQERDFVLISGYAIPNILAVNWFLQKFGRCRLLVWGANRSKYMVLTMNNYREKPPC
jgi:hypothetical protein